MENLYKSRSISPECRVISVSKINEQGKHISKPIEFILKKSYSACGILRYS